MALDRTVWRLRAGVVDAANPLDVVDGIVPLVGVASLGEVNTDFQELGQNVAWIAMVMMMMRMIGIRYPMMLHQHCWMP